MLSRIIEAHGIATLSLSLVREHTEKIKPPRALYVPFPFGLPLGHPGNVDEQRAVLEEAFAMLDAPSGPVLADFHDEREPERGSPVQASQVKPDPVRSPVDLATEVTMMRRYWEQHVAKTGRTAVGLSRVPPQRFRGVVRFLEEFVQNDDADSNDRPAEIGRIDYVRYCVDDLKSLYLEGRMVMQPGQSPEQIGRWLWGETELGAFLRRLRDTLAASSDRYTNESAYGIAR